MKRQNYTSWFVVMFLVFVGALYALAAMAAAEAGTNAVPVKGAEVVLKIDIWDVGIGVVSPVLIWLLTKVAPWVPKPLLPTITPLVGIGLGALVNWLAGQNLSWFEAAKAGTMAVYFREIVNQWVTKKMAEANTGDTAQSPPVSPPPVPEV